MSARLHTALLGVAALALGGCGGGVAHAPPDTLPASAVPYLASSLKPISAASLAREAQAPGLARKLGDWGYQAGADRYFQGESRELQMVDSRTLRFGDASGASAFVSFVRSHAAAYLGSFPRLRHFASRGRRGMLAISQQCQCHLSNPAYLGVVSRGSTVSWLEINGPGATPRRLASLIGRAP
jgi:hypothetical protein